MGIIHISIILNSIGMNSPFRYGKIVTDEHFINRSNDIQRIQNNISAGINTILISPRRWGKSSLMKQIEYINRNKKLRFVFLDFFNIRSEEDFLISYMREVIKCSISKKEELLNAGREFFMKLSPSFSFGTDPMNDFSLKLAWNDAKKSKDEIINLPEIIAKKKEIKIVVCIDEFQSISKLQDSISFEQELRSYWQYHENVTYCLYGSRRHMMMEIFKEESRAFYRFGDLFLLEKIPEDHWVKFIEDSFKKTGKEISKMVISKMISMTSNHPDYLQQLCHNTWNNTNKEVTEKNVEESLDLVIRSNMLYYHDICEGLSNTQINLLKAILHGERKLTSTATMLAFSLGTPRNVSKNKITLESKDIIEIHGNAINFNDPIFEYWIRNFFLKESG